jgi:hypothetical protein
MFRVTLICDALLSSGGIRLRARGSCLRIVDSSYHVSALALIESHPAEAVSCDEGDCGYPARTL